MSVLKLLIIDTIWDFIYFPVWWYTKGVILSLKWFLREMRGVEASLGLKIWYKNIFTPMYGQYDIQGRIISFLMRIFQIILRTIAFVGIFLFYIVVIMAYLILPIAIIYFIIIHLGF